MVKKKFLKIKKLCHFENTAAAKSLQSCPTLCDPIDSSPPGFLVPGIFQARTLEWVAISCSNAWMWKVKVKSLSRVQLCATPWSAAYRAPPSMGFSRQEYWSGVPLPSLLENTTKKQTLGHWKLSLAYPRWLIRNTETWNLWFCRSEVNPGNFFFWRLPRWLYGQPGSSPTVLNLNLLSKPVS